jgi:uncharacterized protein involved in exopolysaccharide biosynthesis
MSDYVEQEIDLRPYVTAVLDRWYWILGFGLLGALLGLGVSLIMDPTYEATALVAVTVPRERVEFDARIQTIIDSQPLEAYPELARSDELLVALRDQLPDGALSLKELRDMTSASPGSDPSLINLTVEHNDPEFAAEVANLWASLFVQWANQVYGYQGDEQLLFFETQMQDAQTTLAAAEDALISFQARNRSAILENQLAAVQQTQADYLAKQRQTDLILQDISGLLSQEQGGTADIDQLASVLLQVRALGGVPVGAEMGGSPWQLQLNVDGLSSAAPADQRAIILDLQDILLTQSDQINERLAALEPQILTVQEQVEAATVEEGRLTRDFEVAVETYTTLARTVDEKRITSQDTTSGVKLASRTAVPDEPSAPNVLLNAIIAGVGGIILATLAVIVLYWWRTEQQTDESPAPGQTIATRPDGQSGATATSD